MTLFIAFTKGFLKSVS